MIWSVTLTLIGVFGLWLVGRKDWRGFAIALLAQVLWGIYATATHQWGFYLSAIVYGAINAKNLRVWLRKPEPKLEKSEECHLDVSLEQLVELSKAVPSPKVHVEFFPSPEQARELEDYFGALLATDHSLEQAVVALFRVWADVTETEFIP